MRAGFDFGSKNISMALIDGSRLVDYRTIAHNGDIAGTYKKLADYVISDYSLSEKLFFGITGNIDLPGISVLDPVLTMVEANRWMNTGCRSILSIGCERFYLIILDDLGGYVEHYINSDCASGTGSFIDQQAERLGLTAEELADRAVIFKGTVPSISTRCAVFAKSDIIHSQAQGHSKDAIACGICEGVVRTVIENAVRGRDVPGPVIFVGGMSKNKKVELEIHRALKKEVLTIPEGQVFGAIGAAVIGPMNGLKSDIVKGCSSTNRETRNPLKIAMPGYPNFSSDRFFISNDVEITIYDSFETDTYQVYLGIDVGSTSTKAVVLDDKKTILAGLYARTKGDPVAAVSGLFAEISGLFNGKNLVIKGVTTTGSGRKLIQSVISADISLNEITAHAYGATHLDPNVDTIIEIGGQDSKYTLLKDGKLVSATMNYVCAAGTGSFIEEQAQRLGITLDEIADLAIGQSAPYTSDRCTVYMERDLNIFLSEGWDKRQIITAVLYSVRDNYLSKVVGKSPIGKRIYFQGATARNKALVAVFEQELGSVMVSKYCHLTGALGAALYALENVKGNSMFKGIEFSPEVRSEICGLCANKCDLRVYTVNGAVSAWGLKCGKEYSDEKPGVKKTISELERAHAHIFDAPNRISEKTVGMPAALYMNEFASLFVDFFQRLGFGTIVEKGSEKAMAMGKSLVNADFCAPMILTHGLVSILNEKNVDYLFFPAIINEQSYIEKLDIEEKYSEKNSDCYFCYYSQYAPTIVGNLPSFNIRNRMLSPIIRFNNRDIKAVAADLGEELSPMIEKGIDETAAAFIEAYNSFTQKRKLWKEKGSVSLSDDSGKLKIALLGRPYAVFDSRINLAIPKKIESLGYELVYQNMMDLEPGADEYSIMDRMHWYYGQQIMLAADRIAEKDGVYPVFLTCFRCSPDSYLLTYFKEKMKLAQKPYLIIQLDEQTSDVGYETRIEAAIDSFRNDFLTKKTKALSVKIQGAIAGRGLNKGDTVLIPYISSIISEIQRYAFNAAGYDARIVTVDRQMINQGYRHSSGGECMPNVAIVGSLIEAYKNENFDPSKTHLYLPTLCLACNFNQYPTLTAVACRNAGLGDISILSPNALRGLPEVQLLPANLISSILYKLYFRFRPYEKRKGDTDNSLSASMKIIETAMNKKTDMLAAAAEIREIFIKIPIYNERRPLIGVLGDLYSKYNEILNENIFSYIEDLGAEVIIPSLNELATHFLYHDVLEHGMNKLILKMFAKQEEKYEKLFTGILDRSFEPPIDECIDLMKEFGIEHHIIGETTVNVSRMLYYIKHGTVSAVVHLNPVFCCPGVVSSSIFRKIQEKYGVPIIDLFYDGTNRPNHRIVPHLYYISERHRQASEKAADI